MPGKPNYTELANIGTLGRENNQIIDDLLSTLKQIYVTNGIIECDGKGIISGGSASDILPDQTGNDGKYLTTDGHEASWENIPISKMRDTSGMYAPYTIAPHSIGNGSFLITEASGTTLGSKSLSVSTGANLTLKSSAAAGATQYQVSNDYTNRIICAGLVGGVVALSEATADTTVNITSVQINGQNFVPDSSASDSSKNIVITTDASINPYTTISSIRVYPPQTGFSNLYIGQAVGNTGSDGASVVIGQKVTTHSGNANALVGAEIYNAGNGNAVFGRKHISKKNRSFLAGTGHDTSNAKSECVAAVGRWSDLTSTTLFAVGNGSSNTSRSNAFKVNDDGRATVGADPTNNLDVATKQYVDSKLLSYYTWPGVTLYKNDWNSSTLTQTIEVVGVTANNLVEVSPSASSWLSSGDYMVRCISQAVGSLTFKCETIPEEDLDFDIVVWDR